MESSSRMDMETLQRFVSAFRVRAIENLKEHGHVVPTACVFGTVDPDTGKPRGGVFFVPCIGQYGNPDIRQAYANVVRDLAARTHAYAVAFVMEVHISTRHRPEGVSHSEFMKMREQVLPSADPEHVDYVMVQLEHHDLLGPALWLARERQGSDGKVTADAFEQWASGTAHDGSARFEGRFVGLLPLLVDGASA